MISLWALAGEADVEAYAASIVLPDYLAHLELAPFEFSAQASNADGQEPLRLSYRGDGRLEDFLIHPKDHVLPMLRQVCPGIEASRIRLPQDDARWYWNPAEAPPRRMRIYFEPTTRTLYPSGGPKAPCEAYVSVSRGHVFVGRPAVECYVHAWLECLGIDGSGAEFRFDTPSAGVEFTATAVGGQLFLADQVIAEELIRFAGIEQALSQVTDWARLDLDNVSEATSGVREDGVYIQLAKRNDS